MKPHHVVMDVVRDPRETCASVSTRLQGLMQQLRRWRVVYVQRRQLAALSDAALKDIGLSRLDAEQEARRPFWDQ